jgi:cytochrome c oxidase assembly protein subunit 19
MASMNFSSSKQWVKPPQRGIFPLDHDKECKEYMEIYLSCLKREQQQHNKCRELSKDYLQCRMDRQLMAKEDLNDVRIVYLLLFLQILLCFVRCYHV